MSTELETVPPIVQRLAAEQKMHPIKWRIEEDEIVIIFEEGPKMRFPRPGKELTGPKSPPVATIAAGSKPLVGVTKLPRRRK